MSSYTDYTYQINGIVSTDKTVLQNMEAIANACNAWIAYDISTGLWSVVPNTKGTSIFSFNDSNIIGQISVTGTNLDQLYTAVKVQYPSIDLVSNPDFIQDAIPQANWLPNESYKILDIQTDLVNNPTQAEYMGVVELRQNRLDQTISFKTDYTAMGLTAGDIIDVTNAVLGITGKLYRILSLKENDESDGLITIDITAQEYSDSVYDTSNLNYYLRTTNTGIATIGNIGIPGTPTIDKYELDANPRFTVHSTTPTGIVDAMEFWYSQDDYVLDSSRTYSLLGTVKPTAGDTFNFGTTVTVTNNTLGTGNIHVKTRGINGQVTGPFSAVAGSVYTPTQVADSIGPNTTITNSTGSLVTALGALYLLNQVSGLFTGNTSSGGMFSKVFDLFKGNTTVGNVFTNGQNIPAYDTFQVSASTSTVDTQYNAYAGSNPKQGTPYDKYGSTADADCVVLGFNLNESVKTLLVSLEPPFCRMKYDFNKITGATSSTVSTTNVTRSDVLAYAPSIFEFYKDGTKIQTNTTDWQTQSVIAEIANAQPGTYKVIVYPVLTYDFSAQISNSIWMYNFSTYAQASGGGLTLTAYAFY